jgi:hypothetical protein
MRWIKSRIPGLSSWRSGAAALSSCCTASSNPSLGTAAPSGDLSIAPGRACEQHHHVGPQTIGRGAAVARSVGHGRHSLGRTGSLGHHDGGLCGDRMAALPGLSPVEQLIYHQDRDQKH